MATHNFRELKIWKNSLALSKKVLQTTKTFPKQEQYTLTTQVSRSAISIPSNIAEGSSRNSNKEFAHFLSISLGSSYELETQLILAESMGYISNTVLHEFETELNELQRMISNFKQHIIKPTA